MGRKDVLVETLAGAPDPGDADGLGRDARFDGPVGIAVRLQRLSRASGLVPTLYVADCRNHRIRTVSHMGVVTTLAGGAPGDADGPAASAGFRYPCGVAVATDGSVYVADTRNHRIRMIREGMVTTLAGGERGFAAGTGRSARFDTPIALAIGFDTRSRRAGVWVADAGNRRLRFVGFDGRADAGVVTGGMPTSVSCAGAPITCVPDSGVILTGTGPSAGSGTGAGIGPSARSGTGAGIGPSAGSWAGARIGPSAGSWAGAGIGPSARSGTGAGGGVAVGLAGLKLRHPGVAIACQAGGLLATDATQGALLWIRGSAAEVLAGGFQDPGGMCGWRDFSGDQALFGRIGGLVTDADGRIYVADTDANAIRRVSVPELLRRKERGR
jgi:hypothetical protein